MDRIFCQHLSAVQCPIPNLVLRLLHEKEARSFMPHDHLSIDLTELCAHVDQNISSMKLCAHFVGSSAEIALSSDQRRPKRTIEARHWDMTSTPHH